MSIHSSEYDTFVYINYHRQEFKDSERLKRILMNQASAFATKDVVVDFASCSSLTSPEIGSLARLLKIFEGTHRFLRIVTNPAVKKILESTNIVTLSNCVLYDSQRQFIDEVQKAVRAKPPER